MPKKKQPIIIPEVIEEHDNKLPIIKEVIEEHDNKLPIIKEVHLIKDLNITSSFMPTNVLFGSRCDLKLLESGDVECRLDHRPNELIVIKLNNIAAICYEEK
jgi:hypothetical protein